MKNNPIIQQAVMKKLLNEGGVPLEQQSSPHEEGVSEVEPLEEMDSLEIQFRLFPDLTNDVVVLEFTHPIKYIGINADQASGIAEQLTQLSKIVLDNIVKRKKEEENKQKRNERRKTSTEEKRAESKCEGGDSEDSK